MRVKLCENIWYSERFGKKNFLNTYHSYFGLKRKHFHTMNWKNVRFHKQFVCNIYILSSFLSLFCTLADDCPVVPKWVAYFIFNYNQQDATLHKLFISVKRSTCFRRFLCPSSGAQNCIYSIGYFVKPLLLPATVVEEMVLPRSGR